MKIYKPSCGEDITTTIKNALDLSFRYDEEAFFTFNGINMVVDNYGYDGDAYDSTEEYYLSKWKDLCKQRQEKYETSEEYKLAKIKREETLISKQEQLDELMLSFPEEFGSNVEILKWVIQFTKLSDHTGVTFDKDKVLGWLYEQGFEENMWVGYKGEWTFAYSLEYTMGQVINCIKTFGVPHPMTITFCEDLLKQGEQL